MTDASRTGWAMGFASLVGCAVGSFLAPSMDSLGFSTEGTRPLIGGDAALYAAFPLGAVTGMVGAAAVAYLVARGGRARLGAILGSLAGIALSAVAGYFSDNFAQAWVSAYGANPGYGAFAGGILAGALAGATTAVLLQGVTPRGSPGLREGRFAALIGSSTGLLAGFGGGALGLSLSQGGYCGGLYEYLPFQATNCQFLQAGPALGAWAGAISGAGFALIAGFLLGPARR